MSDIETARCAFEERLAELRQAVVEEFGSAPRVTRWVVPVAAAAVGFALAWKLGRRRHGRRRRRFTRSSGA